MFSQPEPTWQVSQTGNSPNKAAFHLDPFQNVVISKHGRDQIWPFSKEIIKTKVSNSMFGHLKHVSNFDFQM